MVEGTFTSIPDVASTMKWGWLPVGPLITQRFDSAQGHPDRLAAAGGARQRRPADPPELGRALYEAARGPKEFVLVKAAPTTTPIRWASRNTARGPRRAQRPRAVRLRDGAEGRPTCAARTRWARCAFDGKLQVVAHALGTHTAVSRVQGSKLKAKREIRVAIAVQGRPGASSCA
jgi:hypothetical protein